MNTLTAYAAGQAHRTDPLMIFDWDRAARLIREKAAQSASAGLQGDWEYTGGTILRDSEPVTDGGTYLASTWAIPELEIDDDVIECWRLASDSPGWDADTVWPPSAVAILRGKRP